MSEIFISYARSTSARAQQIAEALQAMGYGVWRDSELPAHRAYAEVIEERLKAAKAVVVVWSAEAVRSEWVQSEADRARMDRKLVQLSVDTTPLPMPFDRIQCADLADWRGDAEAPGWKKVVGSIAELVRGGVQSTPAAAPKAASATHRASICVLPFANMSGEAEQEYFSDGISEDIITDLSKISALFVTARNTAFTFKGRSVKIPEVARDLGVSHVLEGSVRKAGGRVRITAQLIEGDTGGHIWAERYDRDLTDIFAVQDEISEAIVMALRLRLLPQEKQAIEKRGTTSAEAYDLFLMARQHRELVTDDPRRHETIIRLCEGAITIDPNYAQAWTLIGAAQMWLSHRYGQQNDAGAAAIAAALRLDPDLGEARALRARELYQLGRRDEALAELDVALRLDPESYDVNWRAGNIYYDERRLAEAVRLLRKAADLKETDFFSPTQVLSALTALGDEAGAREAAQVTLERVERALALDRSNGGAMAHGVFALAALGQRDRAKEWISRALLLEPDNVNIRYNFACALSRYFEDVDGALSLLAPVFASERGAAYLPSAQTDPDFEPLRRDPRFPALLAEAGSRLTARKQATPS